MSYIMVWLMGLRYLKCSVSVVTEDHDGLESYLILLRSDLDSWLTWAHRRDFYLRINFVKELVEGRV